MFAGSVGLRLLAANRRPRHRILRVHNRTFGNWGSKILHARWETHGERPRVLDPTFHAGLLSGPTPSFVPTYLVRVANGHLYLKSCILSKTAIWPRKCVKITFSRNVIIYVGN